MRNQVGKQALDAAQEFSGLRERANVLANLWIRAVVWAQTWNEMRIGKKAHVKDQVRIRRHAITIAKADHGNQQRPRVGILEARGNEVAKLVHVELRGIDDHIGEFADRLHQRALVAQAFAHRIVLSEGMRTARFAIAAQQRVFVSFNEDQRNRVILLEMFQQRGQFFELQSLTRVYQQGRSREITFASTVKLRKNGNQVHREVVHAVETHVFEGAENRAFAGTGKTGKDDELARILARSHGGLHGRAAQLFTRR